jgi:hypothetical protein
MDSKHTSELADGTVEHPARVVALVGTKLNDAMIVGFHSGQKLSARRSHGTKAKHKLSFATKFAKFRGQEFTNPKNGLHAMVRNFHFRWNIENAPIFEERENPASGRTFRLRRIPLNPEDGDTESGDTGEHFAKFHWWLLDR